MTDTIIFAGSGVWPLDAEVALEKFVRALAPVLGEDMEAGRFVRDVFGALSFVAPERASPEAAEKLKALTFGDFGFLSAMPIVEARAPYQKALLKEKGIQWETADRSLHVTLLDRRLAGEGWLQEPSVQSEAPVRIAFHGLKGGVGRSTALAVAASELASRGHNVLVVDLDLEAPGQSDLLLNPEFLPDYGVVDWLAARTAGLPARDLTTDMIGGSPYTRGAGVVDVVPTNGRSSSLYPAGYLSKLARAYTPGVLNENAGLTFSDKIGELLAQLSERRSYGAILIDVRAGLHETSAAPLLTLGCHSYLFGTNSAQTFSGYRILLSSIRQAMSTWPESADIRDRFRMVHGRAAGTPNDRAEFTAQCWRLWLETLYDEAGEEPDASAFSFDLDDEQGPHFPQVILANEVYLNFDRSKGDGLLESGAYGASFGDFVSHVVRLVEAEVAL